MSLREADVGEYRDAGDSQDASIDVAGLLASVRRSAPDGAAFTVLETQVIAIARGDTLASLEPPGRFERLFGLVFGLKTPARALADARLEALRRAVVVTRHRHHMPDAVAADLRRAGFAAGQLRAIEALATQG